MTSSNATDLINSIYDKDNNVLKIEKVTDGISINSNSVTDILNSIIVDNNLRVS